MEFPLSLSDLAAFKSGMGLSNHSHRLMHRLKLYLAGIYSARNCFLQLNGRDSCGTSPVKIESVSYLSALLS